MSNNPKELFIYSTNPSGIENSKGFRTLFLDYYILTYEIIFEGFSSEEEILSVFVKVDGDCVDLDNHPVPVDDVARVYAFGDPILFKAVRLHDEIIAGGMFAVFDFGSGRRALVKVTYDGYFRLRKATLFERWRYYRVMRSRKN